MLDLLIVCDYNSGRSQIACTYFNEYGGNYFTTDCAGLEPMPLNPLVILAMREEGYDISTIDSSKSVFDLIEKQQSYDLIITVCSEESDKKCSDIPCRISRLNWPHLEPKQITGGRLDRFQQIRNLRDRIKVDVIDFIHRYEANGMKILQ